MAAPTVPGLAPRPQASVSFDAPPDFPAAGVGLPAGLRDSTFGDTGLVLTKDAIDMADRRNKDEERAAWRSSLAAAAEQPGLVLDDVRDALLGIPDALRRDGNVIAALSKGDRLRGLGALLIVVAIAGMGLTHMF